MKRIQSFEGIIVYDHEEKRFWSRREIIELATTFWQDAGMIEATKDEELGNDGQPTDDDLQWIFREEFQAFIDMRNPDVIAYWDDAGTWEMLEAPCNYGLGMIEENSHHRIVELSKEVW